MTAKGAKTRVTSAPGRRMIWSHSLPTSAQMRVASLSGRNSRSFTIVCTVLPFEQLRKYLVEGRAVFAAGLHGIAVIVHGVDQFGDRCTGILNRHDQAPRLVLTHIVDA